MDYVSITIRLPRPGSQWLRFSLRLGLAILSLLAIAFAVYRAGQDHGFRAGYDAGNWAGNRARIVLETYSVADLVQIRREDGTTVIDYDPLIHRLKESVYPGSWEESGGPASIQWFPTNLSLVVSHSPRGHAALANQIDAIRAELREAQ
jgi:hypothetical protein